MKGHKMKIDTEYWQEIVAGNKKSEVRFNDRDYQKGDIMSLHETFRDGTQRLYTAGDSPVRLEITHIHSGLGMQRGYVVISFKKLTNK